MSKKNIQKNRNRAEASIAYGPRAVEVVENVVEEPLSCLFQRACCGMYAAEQLGDVALEEDLRDLARVIDRINRRAGSSCYTEEHLERIRIENDELRHILSEANAAADAGAWLIAGDPVSAETRQVLTLLGYTVRARAVAGGDPMDTVSWNDPKPTSIIAANCFSGYTAGDALTLTVATIAERI